MVCVGSRIIRSTTTRRPRRYPTVLTHTLGSGSVGLSVQELPPLSLVDRHNEAIFRAQGHQCASIPLAREPDWHSRLHPERPLRPAWVIIAYDSRRTRSKDEHELRGRPGADRRLAQHGLYPSPRDHITLVVKEQVDHRLGSVDVAAPGTSVRSTTPNALRAGSAWRSRCGDRRQTQCAHLDNYLVCRRG